LWWPALVAALFAAAQLAFVAPRLGLSWDEVVYISQASVHAPAAYVDPARARGIPLLVAPVTLLTGSVFALRVYLSLASGLALFLALLVIPVADALAWLVTGVRADYRDVARLAVGLALAGQLLVQHVVLDHQVAEKVTFFGDYSRIAAQLHELGVRPPCLVKGEQDIPIAFYAGCGSAGSVPAARGADPGERLAVLASAHVPPPGYASGWHAHRLHDIRTSLLRLTVYIPR
jgi:hypothetical protein